MNQKNNHDQESIILEAKKLVDDHGSRAAEVVNRKINNLKNQYCRENDFNFLLLTEVEKILEANGGR
jgi:hypothetical protein